MFNFREWTPSSTVTHYGRHSLTQPTSIIQVLWDLLMMRTLSTSSSEKVTSLTRIRYNFNCRSRRIHELWQVCLLPGGAGLQVWRWWHTQSQRKVDFLPESSAQLLCAWQLPILLWWNPGGFLFYLLLPDPDLPISRTSPTSSLEAMGTRKKPSSMVSSTRHQTLSVARPCVPSVWRTSAQPSPASSRSRETPVITGWRSSLTGSPSQGQVRGENLIRTFVWSFLWS